MNSVIYARVSTSEQKNANISVPVQINKCKDFAKTKEYAVLSVFKDDGMSGSNEKRPGLLDMMAYCQKNKVDRVLVLDTDRFARDENIHFGMKAILKKCGTEIESLNQPMINDSPEGKFLDSVLAAVNAFYPKVTGRKTSLSMDEKAKLGLRPGPAPLGYKNIIDESKEGLEKHNIAVHPLKGRLVTESFRLFSTGLYNAEQLSNLMFEKGLRSTNEKQVSRSEITRMLRSIFYIGKFEYKGKVIDGQQKHLIDDKTFQKCQRILDEHNHFSARKRRYHFLLSGYAYCDICGRMYTADYHTNREKAYYHCPSSTSVHSNKKQNIETHSLEKEVAELFKTIVIPEPIVQKIVVKAREILSNVHNNLDEQKRLGALRKQQLQTRKQKLEIKLLDGVINDETYIRQDKLIQEGLNQLEINEAGLNDNREENIAIFEKLLRLSRDVYAAYIQAKPQQKRVYLSLFWEKIYVKNRRIKKAVPSKLFQTLLTSQILPNSELTGYFRKSYNWLPGSDSNGQHAP